MIRTGKQYLDSIRDGREVYINGERVKDVTSHPMLKPLVDIRARIYDMQHAAATRELLDLSRGRASGTPIANKLPRTQRGLVGQAARDRHGARRHRRGRHPGGR